MLKKSAGVAAGTGLVVATTGCGIIPGLGASPIEMLQQSVQETQEIGAYRAEVTSSGSIGDEPATDTTAEIVFTEDPEPTIELTNQDDNSVALIRGTEFLVDDGSGEWLRMDFEEMGEDTFLDPKAQVDQLMAGQNVEETGSEEVNGVEATIVEGSYPIQDALDQIEDSEIRDQVETTYEEAGVEEVPFTVWVGDGLPQRVQYEIGDYEETIDFLEFGQDVSIEWPSEDQISDMDEMFDDPMSDMPSPDVEMPDAPDLDQEMEDLEQDLEDLENY
ncbi:hypothetical protein F4561_000167 [Lipingzhangella halophila]|uniref:Uncharacterized protein n=1 Tax=Lipingzhangella halophila TaxID=1783352 RepID=A0A7W7RCA2_9ACTN|nr:LppX_LprAFG lipoprotein [Lipingzhangella halophila]MBB4929347.1 hypothetical protein [Lipingzhangella halophila]